MWFPKGASPASVETLGTAQGSPRPTWRDCCAKAVARRNGGPSALRRRFGREAAWADHRNTRTRCLSPRAAPIAARGQAATAPLRVGSFQPRRESSRAQQQPGRRSRRAPASEPCTGAEAAGGSAVAVGKANAAPHSPPPENGRPQWTGSHPTTPRAGAETARRPAPNASRRPALRSPGSRASIRRLGTLRERPASGSGPAPDGRWLGAHRFGPSRIMRR